VLEHHSVPSWGTHLSMSKFPFTHKRAPSSDSLQKVYGSEYSAWTCPVHRTLQPSRGMPLPGLIPVPLESITGSVRIRRGVPDIVIVLQYSPFRPLPDGPPGGVKNSCGRICLRLVGLLHFSFAKAAPPASKYSI